MMTMFGAMRKPFHALCRRLGIIGLGGLLAFTLVGCSTVRLGYDQGATLAWWWLDSRLDFDDRQTPQVKAALAQWFEWHRATQLEDYAALLARARGESAAGGLDADRICRWAMDVRGRAAPLLDRLAAPVAQIAVTLTPAQIDRLAKRLAKDDAEDLDDFVKATAGQRIERSVQRTVERYERFYGTLGQAQRAAVLEAARVSPYDPQRRLAERQARQAEVIALLRRLSAEKPAIAQAETLVRATFARLLNPPQDDGGAYQDAMWAHQCGLAARLHASATAAQKLELARRLEGWESDARALASAAPRSTATALARP
jgi:hypothetical protein